MIEIKNNTNSDLDTFEPSQPQKRLDEKAAALEAEINERKADFNKERFVYIFCLVALFEIIVGQHSNGYVFSFSIIASVLFLIGIGKWLDFPFIHDRLDRWERLIFEAARKKLTGKSSPKTEPLNGE